VTDWGVGIVIPKLAYNYAAYWAIVPVGTVEPLGFDWVTVTFPTREEKVSPK